MGLTPVGPVAPVNPTAPVWFSLYSSKMIQLAEDASAIKPAGEVKLEPSGW